MKISVIIPFYNPGTRLTLATESALAQPETAEIILVDDGSTDHSGQIALQLINLSEKISLITLNQNMGPAVARNHGIKKSIYPFIAFLDADDQYLPNRFVETKQLFQKHPTIDAAFGAIENHFHSDTLREEYQSIYGSETDTIFLYSSVEDQTRYFETLALARQGSIHLDALVIKREALKALGGFDSTLRQMEDTDLILRLALKYKLASLSTSRPLACRHIHGGNLILSNQPKIDLRLLFLSKWIEISVREHKSVKVILHFLRSYLGEHPYAGRGKFSVIKTWTRKLILLFRLIRSHK